MLLPRPEALTLSEGQYPLNLQLQPQALSRTPEEESQCPSHLHADVTGISGSLCLKQLLIQPRPAPPTAFPIPTAEAETVASSLIPSLTPACSLRPEQNCFSTPARHHSSPGRHHLSPGGCGKLPAGLLFSTLDPEMVRFSYDAQNNTFKTEVTSQLSSTQTP